MGSFDRKIKRQLERRKKKEAQRDLNEKVALYNKLDTKCLVCVTPFDKNDKKMLQEWYIVVRNAEEINLYCPLCWNEGLKKIEKLQQHK